MTWVLAGVVAVALFVICCVWLALRASDDADEFYGD
jgi:hypothetical protein